MPFDQQVRITGTHPYSEPRKRELILLREAAPGGLAIAWDAEDIALVVVDLQSKDNDIIETLFECKRRFPFLSYSLKSYLCQTSAQSTATVQDTPLKKSSSESEDQP